MANDNMTPRVDIMRSGLGRARGLGSAKSGLHHWIAQRITAVALVPLTLWFIYGVLTLQHADQAAMLAWMHSPLHLVLMLALIGATFHHMHLGLQTVLEDYIHGESRRLAALLAMRGITVLLALTAAVSALKMGL